MNNQPKGPLPLVWWIMWFAILNGLIMMFFILRPPASQSQAVTDGTPIGLIGVIPLALSCILRWAVFPKINSLTKMFPLFILGMAMAESCGLIGIFMGGKWTNALIGAAFMGIFQFAPTFLSRFENKRPG